MTIPIDHIAVPSEYIEHGIVDHPPGRLLTEANVIYSGGPRAKVTFGTDEHLKRYNIDPVAHRVDRMRREMARYFDFDKDWRVLVYDAGNGCVAVAGLEAAA